jgi:glyoxylase-like metal-dependent hydrolase (beta-lactamase superfamily II)
VNAYLLSDPEGSFLVDCGIWDPNADDGGFKELEAAVGGMGRSLEDVKVLMITHAHIDHFGMAGRLVEEVGCELWMHEAARDQLEMYGNPDARAEEMRAMLADHGASSEDIAELTAFEDWRPFVHSLSGASRWLREGETFNVGGRTWTIVHTPGHDAAHICLWAEEDRILLSGDTLLGSVTPHIDFRRGDENPLGDYLASLAKIEGLEPRLVLPGHGRPFEDGAERARVTARHHERRLGAIVQVVRREPHTANEITDEIFGETLLNFERRLAFGEALAHLAYLRRSGEIERLESEDKKFLYIKKSRRGNEGDK